VARKRKGRKNERVTRVTVHVAMTRKTPVSMGRLERKGRKENEPVAIRSAARREEDHDLVESFGVLREVVPAEQQDVSKSAREEGREEGKTEGRRTYQNMSASFK
jgi:hypothetical protein